MKNKIILSIAAISLLTCTINAKSLEEFSMKNVNIKVGTSLNFDNYKLNDKSDKDSKVGGGLFVECEKNIYNKLNYASKLSVSGYNDYEIYSLEANLKYNIYNKINTITGISYNIYEVEGKDPRGFGLQAGLEYQLDKNVNLYGIYKYSDLNNGVDYSENISFGLEYKF